MARKAILVLSWAAVCAAVVAASAAAQIYVRPYVRADGTFVEGHYRSLPNGIKSDNLSHRDAPRNPVPRTSAERGPPAQPRPPAPPAARQPKS
jgi:hypothetical protein